MSAQFASVGALRESIISAGNLNPEYAKRMLHTVPEMPTIKSRAAWLVEKARDRAVVDIGCTGPISEQIKAVAKLYFGVDCVEVPGSALLNIDQQPDDLPRHDEAEAVIVAEVLEHLSNPGRFLDAVKRAYPGRDLIVTVPHAGAYSTHRGSEVVNGDHVCWYSYTTITNLLRRHGYKVKWSCWYNGEPHKAEGLLIEAVPV